MKPKFSLFKRSALVAALSASMLATPLIEVFAADDVVTTASSLDLGDINPHLYDTRVLFAQSTPFEGLVQFNPEGEIVPMLATEWEVSEDGKTYTFQIREGVEFTDGEPLNAAAIEKNFQALMDNRERHEWMDIFAIIEKWEATGEYEFTLTLSKPHAATLNDLGNTRPFKMVSPKQFVDGGTMEGINEPVGTGAYLLGDHEEDEFFEFVRNDGYWGDAPDIEKYVFKVMPDNDLQALAFEKGDLDYLYGTEAVGASTYQEYEDKEGFEAALSTPNIVRSLIFNAAEGPLKDVAVREALAYGVDRETMAESLFNGLEDPAGRLFFDSLPFSQVELEEYTYDVDRANQVLEEAGWELNDQTGIREKDGQPLQLSTYYITTHVDEKEMAEYLQAIYREVGIELEIIGEESQSVRDRYDNGEYDIVFRGTWGPSYDPYAFIGTIGSTQTSLTYSAQGVEDFDQLREKILHSQSTPSDEERQEDYDYILTTLHEEFAFIPLTAEKNRIIYKDALDFEDFPIIPHDQPLKELSFKE